MANSNYKYVTLTPRKLDTLIKLSTTGYKSGELNIKKNLSRAKELQWLRDRVWEMDGACWQDGVRHAEGLFQVPGNCFCCKIMVGNPSQVRKAKKGEMEYRHHCRRCGRLVCDLCSKQNIKLWVFWDVDSEKLKACKNSDDRESMRCCDNCVRQLHAGEEEIAFQLEVEAKDDSGVEEEIDCDINKKKDDVKNADNNINSVGDENLLKRQENPKDVNDTNYTGMDAHNSYRCQVCGGDFKFLHGWKNLEMAQVNDLYMCMPCKMDSNIPMSQRKLYSIFLNDIPPRLTNEDLYSILFEHTRERNRLDFRWTYAYCTISLDSNGMPFLSDSGLGRAVLRFYQIDIQQWFLEQKTIVVKDEDHFYSPKDEFVLRISKKPLLVADSGEAFSRWGNIKLTNEVALYAREIMQEKIALRKMKIKVGRGNRRAYGGNGVLRCPGKLGGCGLNIQNNNTGICAECGGLRVSRENLSGGRQSSYDDAVDAARMNDETRLSGIFSLQSRAVTDANKNVAPVHFTEPTITVDKGNSEFVMGKSHRGQTALHVAAVSGSYESVKVLLDLNYCNKKQTMEEIRKLGDKQVLVLPRDMYGSTPLHLAAMEGHADIVELFLNRGVSQVMNNNIKRLPLHYAAANGHLDVCELLLRSSTEQLLMKDIFGKSPLDLARKSDEKSDTVIEFLLAALEKYS
eukprot:g996.t1